MMNCIHIFVGKSLSCISTQRDTGMNAKNEILLGNLAVNLRLLHTGLFSGLHV